MKLFRNLIFTTLALAAGRVVAFPFQVTVLTKGEKNKITIVLVHDMHLPDNSLDEKNAQAILEYAKRINAQVFVENMCTNKPNTKSSFAPNNIQRVFDLGKMEWESKMLGKITSKDVNVHLFDPRDALETTRLDLFFSHFVNGPSSDKFYSAFGAHLKQTYQVLSSIQNKIGVMFPKDCKFKSFCEKQLAEIIAPGTIGSVAFEWKPADDASNYLLGKFAATKIIKEKQTLYGLVIDSNEALGKLIALQGEPDGYFRNDLLPLLDIEIILRLQNGFGKNNQKNFIICSGGHHCKNIRSLFTSIGFENKTLATAFSSEKEMMECATGKTPVRSVDLSSLFKE